MPVIQSTPPRVLTRCSQSSQNSQPSHFQEDGNFVPSPEWPWQTLGDALFLAKVTKRQVTKFTHCHLLVTLPTTQTKLVLPVGPALIQTMSSQRIQSFRFQPPNDR